MRKTLRGTRNPSTGSKKKQGTKKERLGKKLNLLGPVELHRRPPELGEALGKRAGGGGGKKHTQKL